MANFNQTNINRDRFFFATKEEGEQDLFTQTQTSGNFTDFYVGITGAGGNLVQVNQMPDIIGTSTTGGEEMLYAGTASTYKTLSTLSGTAAGVSLSTDRIPGSGIATIESYGTNGSVGGFELLSRGVNSALVSSVNVNMNNYLSTIGNPGATQAIRPTGSLLAGDSYVAPFFTSLNAQAGGGGRPCFGIQDLSGALGVTPQPRWAIGTTGIATGGNSGSDYALYSYSDAGTFIDAPMTVRRADSAMAIKNISSIQATLGGTARGQVFPIIPDNTEFGAPTNDVFVLAGATSNQALYGTTFPVIFSTPVANLNPNLETLLNINWANSLSTGSNHVNFKLGFSTATAYTNIIQTSYVPGLGGTWTPSDTPGNTTPIGHTNICAVLDPDGLTASGDGFLYVMGQLSDPSAAADQLYIAKGSTSEPTRNALTYKTV
jgi:hypothetical protein